MNPIDANELASLRKLAQAGGSFGPNLCLRLLDEIDRYRDALERIAEWCEDNHFAAVAEDALRPRVLTEEG